MEISQLGYYPRFLFMCESTNFCYSHADVDLFKDMKYVGTNKEARSLKIGDEIYFNFDGEIKEFKIDNIALRDLANNTDNFKYGYSFDKDCPNYAGKEKEFLFVVVIDLLPI